MENDNRLLKALITINKISGNKKIKFANKLQKILMEIVDSLQAKSGSIMLLKGRKNLEVAASTNPEIIGLKQSLDEETPSAWVFKNKKPLSLKDISENELFRKKYSHYQGSAFIIAPIIGDNKVLGVLNITDKIGEDIFTPEEQEILLIIVSQVISTLDNIRLTKQLKKKKKTLQQTNIELNKLEKLKTDLFNMLIHDLKGPISEMVANLDILTYVIEGENLDYVKSAQSGCDTLYRMVSNLLDIARLEENKLKLIPEAIEPRDIMKEAIGRVFTLAKMKGLSIKEECPDENSQETFKCDRSLFLRILQNLLSNAIQYSPPGETINMGINYSVEGLIEFYVQDYGPGIPPIHHETIFEKFEQVGKKKEGRIYSTGLGLAFCKIATEAHKGSIRVISDGIKGTRFSVNVPMDFNK